MPWKSVPTEDEVAALLAKIDHFEDFVLTKLLAQTGVRQGEAFAMNWGDLDFKLKQIRIGYRRDFKPKTSTSNGILYPTDELFQSLKKLQTWYAARS